MAKTNEREDENQGAKITEILDQHEYNTRILNQIKRIEDNQHYLPNRLYNFINYRGVQKPPKQPFQQL